MDQQWRWCNHCQMVEPLDADGHCMRCLLFVTMDAPRLPSLPPQQPRFRLPTIAKLLDMN